VLDAIRKLCRGELLYSAREMLDLLRLANEKRRELIAAQAAISALTPRELEVLQLLAWGKDVVEISQQLYISSETVRTHIHRALNKLGTRSRLRAVLFAVQYGAISLELAP
jgi:DNA-binding NarL/FixJ family response regulator